MRPFFITLTLVSLAFLHLELVNAQPPLPEELLYHLGQSSEVVDEYLFSTGRSIDEKPSVVWKSPDGRYRAFHPLNAERVECRTSVLIHDLVTNEVVLIQPYQEGTEICGFTPDSKCLVYTTIKRSKNPAGRYSRRRYDKVAWSWGPLQSAPTELDRRNEHPEPPFRVWSIEQGRELNHPIRRGFSRWIFLGFTPNGNQVTVATPESIILFDWSTGQIVKRLHAKSTIFQPSTSLDGRLIVFLDGSQIVLWDLTEDRHVRTTCQIESPHRGMFMTSDGRQLITVGYEWVLVWNVNELLSQTTETLEDGRWLTFFERWHD